MCRGRLDCKAFELLRPMLLPEIPPEWFRVPTRPYEYSAVAIRLRHLGRQGLIVNMASGPAEPGHDPAEDPLVPMYRAFWKLLAEAADLVIHADLFEPGQPYPRGSQYVRHDIRDPWLFDPADLVIGVGALNGLQPEYQVPALQQMLAAAKIGGRLIATWDRESGANDEIGAWLRRSLGGVAESARVDVVYLEIVNRPR